MKQKQKIKFIICIKNAFKLNMVFTVLFKFVVIKEMRIHLEKNKDQIASSYKTAHNFQQKRAISS